MTYIDRDKQQVNHGDHVRLVGKNEPHRVETDHPDGKIRIALGGGRYAVLSEDGFRVSQWIRCSDVREGAD